jgi:hypothetical protein
MCNFFIYYMNTFTFKKQIKCRYLNHPIYDNSVTHFPQCFN